MCVVTHGTYATYKVLAFELSSFPNYPINDRSGHHFLVWCSVVFLQLIFGFIVSSTFAPNTEIENRKFNGKMKSFRVHGNVWLAVIRRCVFLPYTNMNRTINSIKLHLDRENIELGVLIDILV